MNKVRYGLKNVHYALVTETEDGQTGEVTSTYGSEKAWKGAVNLTLDANGEDTPFYADDSTYYTVPANNGYTGTLEVAQVPEDVDTDVFGEEKDPTSGIVVEKSTNKRKYIALLFEISGDDKKQRFCFYRCRLQRYSVASATIAESATPTTSSLALTALPRPDDDVIKAKVLEGEAGYADWFAAVPEV